MNVLVTTQMRTGSTWLCEILQDLLGKRWKFWSHAANITNFDERVEGKDGLLVKMHYADPELICSQVENTKVVSITRHLPDIIVSKALYGRYDEAVQKLSRLQEIKDAREELKSNVSDKKYVNVFCQTKYVKDEWKMWKMYNNGFTHKNYLLVHYEDMIEDTLREVEKICNFLELDVPQKKIRKVVKKRSFKNRTGRKRGKEKNRAFRRKGIVGDHKNYLNKKSMKKIRRLMK